MSERRNVVYIGEDYDAEALQHYGIPGMRWGIRRSAEQLGHRVAKMERQNARYTAKLKGNKEARAKSRLAKGNRLLAKAAKYERKAMKYEKKSRPGLFRSEKKAARNLIKAQKFREKSEKKRVKGQMLTSKAESFIAKQDSIRTKIEHNQRVMDCYKKTISAINNGTIKQGKIFMRYEV